MIWEIILWWYLLPMIISIIGVKLVARLDGRKHYSDEDEERFGLRLIAGFIFSPFVNLIAVILLTFITLYLLTDKVFHYDRIGDKMKESFYKFMKWLTK